jgi:hypothetical protein
MAERRKILSSGALALVLAGPDGHLVPAPAPPVPVADATALPPEHWIYRPIAPGVVEIGVPIVPAGWAELGRPPSRVELRVFDVAIPDTLTDEQLDTYTPVARVSADNPVADRPGVVAFPVEGLVGGGSYSAAVLGFWSE